MLAEFRLNKGLERWQHWTEWPLVVLGLAFLVVLILPMATPLTPTEARVLEVANLSIWVVFVLDYFVRLYLAIERWVFVKRHIVDLIVIAVPFLRPFRLLRLFSILITTGRRAGGLVVKRVTIYVIGMALIVMACAAVVVYDAEHEVEGANLTSLTDSLWWAFTTVTTVGYGDHYPVTDYGRFIAALLMITGIALLGTITAAVAAAFVNMVGRGSNEQAEEERAVLATQLEGLKQTVEDLRADIAQLTPR